MESDLEMKSSWPRYLVISLVLVITLLAGFLPQTSVEAVACKYKHTVQAGDTVYYLANLYQVSWQSIADANNLQPPYAITVGQVLCIPGGTAPANTTTKKNKAEPVLVVVPSLSHIFVSVENFLPKTPYYVRISDRRTGASFRIGNFKTNKDGDYETWYNVPIYMTTSPDMEVCVKNTWTDAVSCVRYADQYRKIPDNLLFASCQKEGR
jgi:hypothetical protein